MPDDIYTRIRIMADEEIKLIEMNYSNGNYIGMQKKKKKDNSAVAQNKKQPSNPRRRIR